MGVAWDEVTAEAADNDILYVRGPVVYFDGSERGRACVFHLDGGKRHLSQVRGGALVW